MGSWDRERTLGKTGNLNTVWTIALKKKYQYGLLIATNIPYLCKILVMRNWCIQIMNHYVLHLKLI